MREDHLRWPAADHNPQITLGLDGASNGHAIVWMASVGGGEYVDIGYITDDGLTYEAEPGGPLGEDMWNAAHRGGKAATFGQTNGYDKSPEGTRRRAEERWPSSTLLLDMRKVVDDFLAQEERRLRDLNIREGLPTDRWWDSFNRSPGLRRHTTIDGEIVDLPIDDPPQHVIEAARRLRDWARVDWGPEVAEWERYHAERGPIRWTRPTTGTFPNPDGLAHPAVRLLLGLPALPFDDELGRWADDGGR